MNTNKPSITALLGWVIVLILAGIVIFLCITIYQTLNSTVGITQDSVHCIENTQNCLEFKATYDQGKAVWKPIDFLPLSFRITVGSFEQGQSVIIACPLPDGTIGNPLGAKIQFLLKQDNLKQCTVSAQ